MIFGFPLLAVDESIRRHLTLSSKPHDIMRQCNVSYSTILPRVLFLAGFNRAIKFFLIETRNFFFLFLFCERKL